MSEELKLPPFSERVLVPRELLLRAAALLSERAPCADEECRLTDDADAVIRCHDDLCAAISGVSGNAGAARNSAADVPACRPDLTHCARCNNNNDRCDEEQQ